MSVYDEIARLFLIALRQEEHKLKNPPEKPEDAFRYPIKGLDDIKHKPKETKTMNVDISKIKTQIWQAALKSAENSASPYDAAYDLVKLYEELIAWTPKAPGKSDSGTQTSPAQSSPDSNRGSCSEAQAVRNE